MRIRIVNRQRSAAIDATCIRALVRRFAEQALEPSVWREICVLLVDDVESGEIHNAVFGDPSPTDVITLRYDGDTEDIEEFEKTEKVKRHLPTSSTSSISSSITAELIVNVARAQKEGCRRSRRGAWSFEHELALYLAHGIDHLSGADDATPADRARMRRRELRWIDAVEKLTVCQRGRCRRGCGSRPLR